jgi:hypothetical protein
MSCLDYRVMLAGSYVGRVGRPDMPADTPPLLARIQHRSPGAPNLKAKYSIPLSIAVYRPLLLGLSCTARYLRLQIGRPTYRRGPLGALAWCQSGPRARRAT